jgi:hypothetical protein
MQEIPGKSIIKKTLDLLRLAKDKGFPKYIEYFDPLEVKSWRHDEQEFRAVVCAAIQLWLQRTYNIEVWAEPITPGLYAAGVQTQSNTWWSMGEMSPGDYSYILMKGLEHVLENLPDATNKPA